MAQKYVVFRYDKKIVFTEDINTVLINETTRVLIFGKDNLSEGYKAFVSQEFYIEMAVIAPQQVEKAFSEFGKLFKIREAAGGIVTNSNNEWLFIYRWQKWDLPKGKLNKGEKPETGALREISEETGLKTMKIAGFAGFTYHIYSLKNKEEILKKTWWFRVNATADELPVPQVEEDITDVRWFPAAEVPALLENSYASLRFLFQSLGI